MHRDEQGRTRTKILVQKRSYLDGGTEVMPGDIQHQPDNLINSFLRSVAASVRTTTSCRAGRSDPFFLPGKNNPYFN